MILHEKESFLVQKNKIKYWAILTKLTVMRLKEISINLYFLWKAGNLIHIFSKKRKVLNLIDPIVNEQKVYRCSDLDVKNESLKNLK